MSLEDSRGSRFKGIDRQSENDRVGPLKSSRLIRTMGSASPVGVSRRSLQCCCRCTDRLNSPRNALFKDIFDKTPNQMPVIQTCVHDLGGEVSMGQ